MAYAEQGVSWFNETCASGSNKLSSSIRKLEDEIDHLRRAMEQTYNKEASFNSEVVIEMSRKLDVKINEYMRQKRETL
ncbi:aspartyl-phosphate phosphatase Spo0E family protein [Paenibacillaceae bacterium]|nr:aspartyl-phosphate phosphatase Spo0E family protein [Paenibacillaceae bacterium]